MEQLVRMHFAQAVEHLGKHVANEILGNHQATFLDEFLQRAAMLILHHHVDRIVGAEKIQHANHVGMGQLRQGPTFFKKTLHAITECRHVFLGNRRLDFAFRPQGQAVWQILLDRDELVLFVGGQIDDRKPAQRKLMLDAVFIELESGRKGVVCLLRHRYRSYHGVPAFSGFAFGL